MVWAPRSVNGVSRCNSMVAPRLLHEAVVRIPVQPVPKADVAEHETTSRESSGHPRSS